MEKLKGNRPNQASAKGQPSDSKKNNQDALGGKQLPRGGRRREPAGGSFPTNKSEPSRKPQPQRARGFDKRPRTRGVYIPGNNAGGAGSRDTTRLEQDELEPEVGSVFVQGSKKQSLNHLLNFHYTPRENHTGGGHTARSPNVGHKWVTTGKHKYNKEHFIQANCQFIVQSSGDYKQYMNNPDALVDWSLIEQINLQVNENPSCPICLYPPSAAKMTRCGHIYCWSCILHYLALSEKSWSKCPICHEAVHQQDLKSVVAVSHPSFNVNEAITFKLMKRARGSLIAYPIDTAINTSEDQPFFVSDAQSPNVNCKLLIANNCDIMAIIEREKLELKAQLSEQIDLSENCFIEQSIAKLQERENILLANLSNEVKPRERFESSSSDMLSGEEQPSSELASFASTTSDPPMKYFYFYQAADGQHIYLHSVNVRMLEHTYGSLEFSPKTISGRIVEKEGGSMTEELRNRFRYLQHLPVTCQFEVAEIQLQSSCINKETADEFSEQLGLRKKRRQKRAREEKRREKKITEEENRQMGKIPSANIELESQVQFPEFGSSPGSMGKERMREDSLSTSRSVSPVSLRSQGDGEVSGPSFATMLTAKRQQPSWPQLKSSPQISQVESFRLINVTGSKLTATPRQVRVDSDNEDEDYVPAPAYNSSFSDAIAMALEKASLSHDVDAVGDNNVKCGQKKKKKNKQKILFATSMTYCDK